MKKLGYLALTLLPGAVLSLAVISGCNSEEAPAAKPAPKPEASAAAPAAPAAPAAKPEEKKH